MSVLWTTFAIIFAVLAPYVIGAGFNVRKFQEHYNKSALLRNFIDATSKLSRDSKRLSQVLSNMQLTHTKIQFRNGPDSEGNSRNGSEGNEMKKTTRRAINQKDSCDHSFVTKFMNNLFGPQRVWCNERNDTEEYWAKISRLDGKNEAEPELPSKKTKKQSTTAFCDPPGTKFMNWVLGQVRATCTVGNEDSETKENSKVTLQPEENTSEADGKKKTIICGSGETKSLLIVAYAKAFKKDVSPCVKINKTEVTEHHGTSTQVSTDATPIVTQLDETLTTTIDPEGTKAFLTVSETFTTTIGPKSEIPGKTEVYVTVSKTPSTDALETVITTIRSESDIPGETTASVTVSETSTTIIGRETETLRETGIDVTVSKTPLTEALERVTTTIRSRSDIPGETAALVTASETLTTIISSETKTLGETKVYGTVSKILFTDALETVTTTIRSKSKAPEETIVPATISNTLSTEALETFTTTVSSEYKGTENQIDVHHYVTSSSTQLLPVPTPNRKSENPNEEFIFEATGSSVLTTETEEEEITMAPALKFTATIKQNIEYQATAGYMSSSNSEEHIVNRHAIADPPRSGGLKFLTDETSLNPPVIATIDLENERKSELGINLDTTTETDFDTEELDAQEELNTDAFRRVQEQADTGVQKSKRSQLLFPISLNNYDDSELEENKRKKRQSTDATLPQPRFLIGSIYNKFFRKSDPANPTNTLECRVGVIKRILKFMASKVPTFIDNLLFGKISQFARASCDPPPVYAAPNAAGVPPQQPYENQNTYYQYQQNSSPEPPPPHLSYFGQQS